MTPDFLNELRRVLKYGAGVTPHPNYERDGYSPDLHALLTTVASAEEDKYPTSVENANVILGSGITNLWPSLGAALKAEGHPLAKALNWKTVERGLQLDHALQTTRVIHKGHGMNADVATFDSLHPGRQRFLLTGVSSWSGMEEHSEDARNAILANMTRQVPDVNPTELAKALERAKQRADILAEDKRRESAHTGYRMEVERHERFPDQANHPDQTRYWNRMGFEGPPAPVTVNPIQLLLLKPKHARRY